MAGETAWDYMLKNKQQDSSCIFMGHQFVHFGGGGFHSLPCHQHLANQSQEQCDCTERLS